jgi:glycosyltransferase involved in cell wall biosynthesis
MASRNDRPLRVALVIARMNIGGPATHVVELAAGLPPDRFEVRIFTGREGRGEAGMHYLAQEKGVRMEILPSLSPHLGPRDLPAFLSLRSVFRAWRPDIVHTHTAKAGALGRTAARSAGVPAVAHTFHGHVLRGYFSPPAEAFFRLLERLLARTTDRIVTLSPALKRDLVEMRIAPPEKIDVIPLGMDLAPLAEAGGSRRGELRRELDIAPGIPLIGIVGRLAPVKNHRLFLEAARSMVDSGVPARFVVVGDGELRAELESLARKWGIGGAVCFLGWRKDMAPVYAGLDVLTLTSVNEGTPVALIEGMAAGTPVAATAVGGVPDVVRDGETGRLVPAGDSGALHQAWKELLADREATNRMRKQAQRDVLAQFSLRTMIIAISDLYLSISDEKARRDSRTV